MNGFKVKNVKFLNTDQSGINTFWLPKSECDHNYDSMQTIAREIKENYKEPLPIVEYKHGILIKVQKCKFDFKYGDVYDAWMDCLERINPIEQTAYAVIRLTPGTGGKPWPLFRFSNTYKLAKLRSHYSSRC